MQTRARGYTLLELLATTAIVVIVCGLALPNAGQILRDQEGKTFIVELTRTLSFARAAAVTRHSIVTLCRSNDGETCGGEWHQGMLMFTDSNGDRTINDTDQILRHAAGPRSGTLRLRSFPNRQYLQFTPEGFTRQQNGSFTWCPQDGSAQQAQQLIFTQAGRARLARDEDGDGTREDADGTPLRCD